MSLDSFFSFTTTMTFNELVKARQSVRSFKDTPPTKDQLVQVLKAAQNAPSAVNFQPWSFIVITDKQKLAQLHDCYHRDWFNTAPACIVAIGHHDQSWHRQSDTKDFCDVDVSIAITHLTLQATELSLGTCWVCNFDAPKVSALFQLDDKQEPIALIPIGYPTDDVKIVEKKRKSIVEITKWI